MYVEHFVNDKNCRVTLTYCSMNITVNIVLNIE